jgi:NADPH:quinone reductase-like Zn-dependent oxidoreductase
MRAAILEKHGAPFTVIDMPQPVAGPGQVLVRIKASGVNPLDLKIRAGQAGHARHALPAILGMDLAGVVERVGDGVDAFRPGDEVYGLTGGVGGIQGSLAEFAAVDAGLLALKPANLTMREAAALPLIFITAWEGLVDRAALRAGQTVLVQGGAGGVGHIAVQIASALGATVCAVDGAAKAPLLHRLGAAPTGTKRSMPMSPAAPVGAVSTWSTTPSAARHSMPRSRRSRASATSSARSAGEPTHLPRYRSRPPAIPGCSRSSRC